MRAEAIEPGVSPSPPGNSLGTTGHRTGTFQYRDGSSGDLPLDIGFWYPRIRTMLRVAEALRSPISREDLLDVLPPGPRASREDFLQRVLDMLRQDLDGGMPGLQPQGPHAPEGGPARVRSRIHDAAGFVDSLPSFVQGCVRLVAVTGSTVYGNPAPGDDIDLFLVTGRGSLWFALLGGFLGRRWRRRRSHPGTVPEYCLNFVLDEVTLPLEFAEPHGFLFAREALMMQPVRGAGFLRRTIERARWLGREIPGLYARRLQELPADIPPEPPVGVAIQIVNLALFPLMATYLQLKALLQNHAHRQQGNLSSTFRLETALHRFAVRSWKYERLIALYTSGIGIPDGSGPSERGHVPGGAGPNLPGAEPDPPER
jgi:hypothetical protein